MRGLSKFEFSRFYCICILEFHKQCSAMAPVLSKEKISERDNEARDPTAAVKDWVKTVDLLKAGSYL